MITHKVIRPLCRTFHKQIMMGLIVMIPFLMNSTDASAFYRNGSFDQSDLEKCLDKAAQEHYECLLERKNDSNKEDICKSIYYKIRRACFKMP